MPPAHRRDRERGGESPRHHRRAALGPNLGAAGPCHRCRRRRRDGAEETGRLLLSDRTLLRFMTCGSVDDGKSTLIGRLLYESQLLYDDQLAALETDSKRLGTRGGDLDFALL